MVRPVDLHVERLCPQEDSGSTCLFCVNCWCDVLASSVPRPLGDSSLRPPCHMPYHTIFHFITFHTTALSSNHVMGEAVWTFHSPYPGSTPGLNPCNHLAWLACGPLADTQTQHIPDHVASVAVWLA
jgi:hypothetical protein